MKAQLLPSSFGPDGAASPRQHLSCVVIDDCVAFDAGSLALSCSDRQREQVRDIVISHVHLDHIAGLPLFIDDLFSTLTAPVRVHASPQVIGELERDIFNWTIYPRFSELQNEHGHVLEYRAFDIGTIFQVKHLSVLPIEVNHKFPSVGMVISDGTVSLGLTGDTASTDNIWRQLNDTSDLAAIFVECAFPDEMAGLADNSNHLTPSKLAVELGKLTRPEIPVYVYNIKPMFRDAVVRQIGQLAMPNVNILEAGRVYDF